MRYNINMTKPLAGTIHDKVPVDLAKILRTDSALLETWESLTPLARNEWICWVENAKLNETRTRRISRTQTELAEGKRRPCCWIGCIHRTDKEIAPSVRGILEKKARK